MNEFKNIRQVYFLGIGGIGMSALARWFAHAGFQVSGYDRTKTNLTEELEKEGMSIHYEDFGERLGLQLECSETLVVYTPAVPSEMGEFQFLSKSGFLLKKRSEVLGMICKGFKTCAVAGTHGKTTVSTMLAHIFKTSALDCTAFLGGISKNYRNNLLLSATSDYVVVEADEFDRSFLRLFPDFAVITSMDADHLDIYGDHNSVKEAFNEFAGQVRTNGKLVAKKGLPVSKEHFSYSLNEQADFYAVNIELKDEAYHFDLIWPEGIISDVVINYPGLLNVENAVAASSLALLAGINPGDIKKALASYQGVVRRFDIRYRSDNYLLIDDYAHHPQELKATISSVRAMFTERHITGIFQPHLYSRTNDFADDFAEQLSMLDEVILLDIYPAREEPIPGVSSSLILNKIKSKHKRLVSKEELLKVIPDIPQGVILMMGAGDIDRLVVLVGEILKKTDNA